MATGNRINYTVGFNTDASGLRQAQTELNRLQQSLNEIANAPISGQLIYTQGIRNSFNDLEKAKRVAKEVSDALAKSFNTDLGTLNVTKFNNELAKSNLDIQKVYASLAKLGPAGQTAFRNITAEIAKTKTYVKQINPILKEMGDTIKNTVRWGLTSSIWNNMTTAVSEAYSYVKKLDTSLNDIRIVTGKNADEMERFAKVANKAAQNLGQNTTAYTNASLIYYQQGLSDAEVKARTDTTLKAANVTGQSTAEVSKQLTAVWNGYKVAASETELYVDKLAAVAGRTAADLEELSTGMSKVASAANNMGVDVDQLNAQLATIISVTKEAPEAVGTSLKSIYSRISDIRAGSGEVTLGNYTKKMAQLGIKVLDENKKLKDLGVTFEEIGEKWQTMSREQQVALARTIGGTYQFSRVTTLFDNWDKYSKTLEVSANAAGTLQEQQDIYMESMEAHLKQLTAAGEELIQSFVNTDSFNPLIDGLTTVTKLFSNFINVIGGGAGALSLFGGIALKAFGPQISAGINNMILNMRNSKQSANDLINTIKTLDQVANSTSVDVNTKEIASLQSQIKRLGKRGLLTQEQQDAITQENGTFNEYLRAQNKEVEAVERQQRSQDIQREGAENASSVSQKTREIYDSIRLTSQGQQISQEDRDALKAEFKQYTDESKDIFVAGKLITPNNKKARKSKQTKEFNEYQAAYIENQKDIDKLRSEQASREQEFILTSDEKAAVNTKDQSNRNKAAIAKLKNQLNTTPQDIQDILDKDRDLLTETEKADLKAFEQRQENIKDEIASLEELQKKLEQQLADMADRLASAAEKESTVEKTREETEQKIKENQDKFNAENPLDSASWKDNRDLKNLKENTEKLFNSEQYKSLNEDTQAQIREALQEYAEAMSEGNAARADAEKQILEDILKQARQENTEQIREIETAVKNIESGDLNTADTDVNEAREEIEPLRESLKQLIKDADFQGVINGVIDLTGSIGTLSAGINGLVNSWQIWENQDISFTEKLLTFLSTMAPSLLMVSSGISSLITNFSSLKKAGAAADLAFTRFISSKKKFVTSAIAAAAAQRLENEQEREGVVTGTAEAQTEERQARANIKTASTGTTKSIGKSFKEGLSGIGKSITGFLSSPLVAVLAGIASVVVAATYAYESFNADQKKAEEEFKQSIEIANKAREAYLDASDAVIELNESLERYREHQITLDKMTTGTEEYTKAVQEANQEVLNLVDSYDSLTSDMISKQGDRLVISSQGQALIEQEAIKRRNDSYNFMLQTRASSIDEKSELEQQNFLRKNENWGAEGSSWVTGVGAGLGAAGLGAAAGLELGSLIGSAIPVVGTVIGAAVGATIGIAVSSFIESQDIQKEHLDAVAMAYQRYGEQIFKDSEALREAVYNSTGVKLSEAQLNALTENTEALKENTKAYTDGKTTAENERIELVKPFLEKKSWYRNASSKEKEQYERFAASQIDIDSENVQQYVREAENMPNSVFGNQYRLDMNTGATTVTFDKNENVYRFYNNAGEEILVRSVGTAKEEWSQFKALNNINTNIQDRVDTMSSSAIEAGYSADSKEYKLLMRYGIDLATVNDDPKKIDFAKYSDNEIKNLPKLITETKNSDNLLFNSIFGSALDSDFNFYREQSIKDKTDLFNRSSYLGLDEDIQKGILANKNLSFNENKEIVSLLTQAKRKGNDVNSLATLFTNEENASEILTLINNFNPNIDNLEDFVSQLEKLGANSYGVQELSNYFKELKDSLNIEEEIQQLINLRSILADIQKVTKNLKIGSIISDEDYNKLINLNPELEKYFMLVAGGYQFTGTGTNKTIDKLLTAGVYGDTDATVIKEQAQQDAARIQRFANFAKGTFSKTYRTATDDDYEKMHLILKGGFEGNGNEALREAQKQGLIVEEDNTLDAGYIAEFLEKLADPENEDIKNALGIDIDEIYDLLFQEDYDKINAIFSEKLHEIDLISTGLYTDKVRQGEEVLAGTINNLDELEKSFAKGDIKAEVYYKRAAILRNEELQQLGTTEEAYKIYSKYLVEVYNLTGEQAEEAAFRVLAAEAAAKKVQSSLETDFENLKMPKDSSERAASLKSIKDNLESIFQIKINDTFVIQYQDLLKQMIMGSKSAYNEIQEIFSDNLTTKIANNIRSSENRALFLDSFESLKQGLEELNFGEPLSESLRTEIENILRIDGIVSSDLIDSFETLGISFNAAYVDAVRLEEMLKKETPNISQSELQRQVVIQSGYDFGGLDATDITQVSDIAIRDIYNKLFLPIFEYIGNFSNPFAPDEKTKKELKESIDRYQRVNEELTKISNSLKIISVEQEHLTGQRRIQNLQKQIVLLKQQEQVEKRKLAIMQEEAAEVRGSLSKFNITFDANGLISNYQEIASNITDSKTLKELNDYVKKYDQLIGTDIPGIISELQSQAYESISKQIEAFDLTFSIKLDLKEAIKSWNEFRNKYFTDFGLGLDKTINDLAARIKTNSQLSQSMMEIGSLSNSSLQLSVQKVQDTYANILAARRDAAAYEKAKREGTLNTFKTKSIFTSVDSENNFYFDEAKAQENLKTSIDDFYKSFEEFKELGDEITNTWSDLYENASSAFGEIISQFERANKVLNNSQQLVKLIGLDYLQIAKNDAAVAKQISENANQQRQVAYDQVIYAANAYRLALETKNEEAIKIARKNYEESLGSYLDAEETAITKIIESGKAEMVAAFKEIMNSSFDPSIMADWSKNIVDTAEVYMDPVERALGVGKFTRTVKKTIDNTTNIANQKKYNSFLDQELKYLREKDKLSESELKRSELKFALLQKQIELEESQNNKNMMRLRRDSFGNYNYEFVANQDEVEDKRQERDDAVLELWEFNISEIQNELTNVNSLQQEYIDSLTAAFEKANGDLEQYEISKSIIDEKYLNKIPETVEALNDAVKSLSKDTFAGDGLNTIAEAMSMSSEEFLSKYFSGVSKANLQSGNLTDKQISSFLSKALNLKDEKTLDPFKSILFDGVEAYREKMNEVADNLNLVSNAKNEEIKFAEDQIKQSLESLNALITGDEKSFTSVAAALGDIASQISGSAEDSKIILSNYKTATESLATLQESYDQRYQDFLKVNAQFLDKQLPKAEAAFTTFNDFAEAIKGLTDSDIINSLNNIISGIQTISNQVQDIKDKNYKDDLISFGIHQLDRIPDSNARMNMAKQINNPDNSIQDLERIILPLAKGERLPENLKQTNLELLLEQFKAASKFDTGGYTGEWGNEGKLAILHEKELVLNSTDTEQFLKIIDMIPKVSQVFDSILSNVYKYTNILNQSLNNLSDRLNIDIKTNDTASSIEQTVHIQADFPDVRDSREIENALNNLVNSASQYAFERRR